MGASAKTLTRKEQIQDTLRKLKDVKIRECAREIRGPVGKADDGAIHFQQPQEKRCRFA